MICYADADGDEGVVFASSIELLYAPNDVEFQAQNLLALFAFHSQFPSEELALTFRSLYPQPRPATSGKSKESSHFPDPDEYIQDKQYNHYRWQVAISHPILRNLYLPKQEKVNFTAQFSIWMDAVLNEYEMDVDADTDTR